MIVLTLFIHALLTIISASHDFPTVTTKLGKIRGFYDTAANGRKISSFTGIPFAEPPVGDLRFKDPVPMIESWEGLLDATETPSMCPQFDFFEMVLGSMKTLTGEEDCLYLNVFTPQVSDEAKLPVMVYIHGGAFVVGSAAFYPPKQLLTEEVVLVVIQYRVGFLGFLSTGDDVASGNYGLKDQTESLRWVRENIGSFGGDPDKVTLFGTSAGAASTHAQMMVDESKGLFKRAIIQSGVSNSAWGAQDKSYSRKFAFEVGSHLECSEDSLKSSEGLLECLRQKPQTDLVKVVEKFAKFGLAPMITIPVVDGNYLKEQPVVTLAKGSYHPVDIMAGYNKDEGAFITGQFYTSEKMFQSLKENFDKMAAPSLGILPEHYQPETVSEHIYQYYLGQEFNFEQQGDQMNELYGDRLFKVSIENAKNSFLKTTANSDTKSYWYELTQAAAYSYVTYLPMQHLVNSTPRSEWVSHADDIFYLFHGGMFPPLTSEKDLHLSNMMVKLWTNFAKTGDPTPDDELGFKWTPSSLSSNLHLDIKASPEMRGDKMKERLAFWNSLPLDENIRTNPEDFDQMVSAMNERTADWKSKRGKFEL